MTRDLPKRWIDRGVTGVVAGDALRGDYFAFQLAVVALRPVAGVTVRFTDLESDGGRTLSSRAVSCIKTEGVGWTGRPFVKTLDVAEGDVQAIWCGLDVPAEGAAPGAYHGEATLAAPGFPDLRVRLEVTVLSGFAERGGADEPWKQTRSADWFRYEERSRSPCPRALAPIRRARRSLASKACPRARDGTQQRTKGAVGISRLDRPPQWTALRAPSRDYNRSTKRPALRAVDSV